MQLDRKTIILLLLLFLVLRGGGGGSSAPFPADKLSVLIVESTEARSTMPAAQTAARDSTLWRAYVESKGGQWRVLDDQTNIDKEADWVKAGMAVKRDSIPWLLVSDGKRGSSEPQPPDLDSLLAKLKETGGQ